MHRRILHIALPSIAANITVPLLGLVDMTITGHLGATAYIGAIAIGANAFSLIYWLFGFLRMGTGGLTAQAVGAGDKGEARLLLVRSVLVGATAALLLLLFRRPLADLAFALFNSGERVDALARTYFSWLIWGAPAILVQYALVGWFVGQQNARFPLLVAVVQNVTNIPASLFFVFALGWKMEGVAAGTLLSQYVGLSLSLALLCRRYRAHRWRIAWGEVFRSEALLRFFAVNRDIFLRTLLVLAVMTYFTRIGASQGEEILAVNALLMQFYLMASYVLDGFAYAGEALGGKELGAGDRAAFYRTVRGVFGWAFALAGGFSLVYLVATTPLLRLLTNDGAVIAASRPYVPYAVALPLVSFGAFIWDGFFIGATATKGMLLSVGISAAVFFGAYHLGAPHWGNHALWCAFIAFLFTRTMVQTALAPRLYPLSR